MENTRILILVEYLKRYPVTKLNVTGYVDVNNGDARINSKLSEARAKNVAEALRSKEIAAARIIVDFKGIRYNLIPLQKKIVSVFV